MAFKLRPTGLGAMIDKDRPDYTIYSGEWGFGRTRHLCITLNPSQRTLNLSDGDTTNNRRARLDSSDPPDPPPSGVLNGKTPQAAGFCFWG